MNDTKKIPPAEINEIASISRDPLLPLFSGLMRQQDDTLATRGQGKGIKLYEEIERDPHAFACLHKRKMAVIKWPWEVTPASDSPADQRAAEVVRIQLAALNFDATCLGLLDAINKGYAVGEIMWQRSGTEIEAIDILLRNQGRFWFGKNAELRLKTLENLMPGEEMPDRKFIVHSVGSKDSNPYGSGLGSKLFWPVWFKRQGITFWLTFLDKFGSPTAVGKYPNGTQPPEQQKLLDALSAISQDAGVTIPEGMVIELLEATRGGNAGYEDMCRYMDEQISYCVLGEAAGAKNSGGAMASAAITRNEVRLELVQFDADMLSATLNRTLVKWITEYNVPGARAPTVWRKIVEAEDIKARAERDKILFDMGMRPDENYQAENYHGWSFPKVANGTGVAFSETSQEVAPSDALAGRLSIEAAPSWDSILDKLRGIVQAATSLESLRDDLLASFGDLPDYYLVKVMSAGFAVAELTGMSDVNDGH